MFKTILKSLLHDIKSFTLNTLFPIVCVECQQEGRFLCALCLSKLKKLKFQQCIICRKPNMLGITHPECKNNQTADGLISFYDYHDSKLAKLIIEGKYNHIKDIYTFLGQLIANEIKRKGYSQLFNNFNLTPIPLAPSRQKWRGFNQAQVLCESLSLQLQLPIQNSLIRQRTTKTQKELSRQERLTNITGAFTCTGIVKNQNYIIVDDVITTGATILEAAKTLKLNGCNKVWCLTVARD